MSDTPRKVKPWDMFNKNRERALPQLAEMRLKVCGGCDRYSKFTHQCKECGCVMNAKVKLQDATCPLERWPMLNIPFDRELSNEEITDITTLKDYK
jgi:hypothetical protein